MKPYEELLEYAFGEVREQYKSTSREIILPFDSNWKTSGLRSPYPKWATKKSCSTCRLKMHLFYKREKLAQYEKLNPDLKVDRVLKPDDERFAPDRITQSY
jgi:excinuclease ABC subunit C